MAQTYKQRNALVEAHLYLAQVIAREIAPELPPCFDVDDLIQAGYIGLIDAATKYQRGRGVPFRNYAAIRVRGAIFSSVRRKEWRNSTAEEFDVATMDVAVPAPNDEVVARREKAKIVNIAIAGLPARDRAVVRGHYHDDKTLVEVGRERLNVGQSRACQIHARALVQLKRELPMRGLAKAA